MDVYAPVVFPGAIEAELTAINDDLSRSNADLEQFAHVASHDLQEPLRAVVGFTKMLAQRYETKSSEDPDDLIARTVNAATRMQEVIHDLLTCSRVGRDPGDVSPTNCSDFIDRAVEHLNAAISETGATVAHSPLPTVTANTSLLTQVFVNLIGNAIKYQADTAPYVYVSAEGRDGVWEFSVRDNGIGIEREYSEHIFVLFKRLHSRTEFPGTGIGLAICKKAVEHMGGRIWVESQPGQGSTFRFTIASYENGTPTGRSVLSTAKSDRWLAETSND